jgi:hypothetical protein
MAPSVRLVYGVSPATVVRRQRTATLGSLAQRSTPTRSNQDTDPPELSARHHGRRDSTTHFHAIAASQKDTGGWYAGVGGEFGVRGDAEPVNARALATDGTAERPRPSVFVATAVVSVCAPTWDIHT